MRSEHEARERALDERAKQLDAREAKIAARENAIKAKEEVWGGLMQKVEKLVGA